MESRLKHNFFRAIALILFSSLPALAGLQGKIGLGYLMMISVEEPLGSPSFVSQGTLYDEISPTASILVCIGTFSIGGTAGFSRASGIFGDFQETTMITRSIGTTVIYNFEMSENGEWLFPMQIEVLHRWMNLEFNSGGNVSSMPGKGWELTGKAGIERVFHERYSIAFLIGRGYIWNEFDGEEFSLHPDVHFDAWRFELFTRISLF